MILTRCVRIASVSLMFSLKSVRFVCNGKHVNGRIREEVGEWAERQKRNEEQRKTARDDSCKYEGAVRGSVREWTSRLNCGRRGGVKGANSETKVLTQSVTESEMRIWHYREKYCRLITRGNSRERERDDHPFPLHCVFVNLVPFLFVLFYPSYPIFTYI